eukprot:m.247760 g.247760  ORF g.247760 m.247760 type:complete len:372 (+) comp17492_c0_seq1:5206-6321(+)
MAESGVSVKVTIPRELSSTNLTYGLIVKTHNRYFSEHSVQVERRFSDFQWLAAHLEGSIPFPAELRALPSTSFIELEKQRKGLEDFFRTAANNPLHYKRNLLHFFLDDQQISTLIQADRDRSPHGISHRGPSTAGKGVASPHRARHGQSVSSPKYPQETKRVGNGYSRSSHARVISPCPSYSASSDASSRSRVRFRRPDSADDASTGTDTSRHNAYDSLRSEVPYLHREQSIPEHVRQSWQAQAAQDGLRWHSGQAEPRSLVSNGRRAPVRTAAAEATAFWVPFQEPEQATRTRTSDSGGIPRSRSFDTIKSAAKPARVGVRSSTRRTDAQRQSPSHAFDQLSLQPRLNQDGWTELSASRISQGSQGQDHT